MFRSFRFLSIAFVGVLITQVSNALANDNVCADPAVLSYIDRDFDIRADRYLHRDIGITDIYNTHRNRFKGTDDTHRVERHYCHASARFSDGRKRQIWYLIERNWGFAGMGRSTEYCVEGLDPWHYYGRYCRSLR